MLLCPMSYDLCLEDLPAISCSMRTSSSSSARSISSLHFSERSDWPGDGLPIILTCTKKGRQTKLEIVLSWL
jgi:hypothetical protein